MKPGTSAMKHSGGLVFRVAFGVVVLVAAAQVLAVVWKVVPSMIVSAAGPSREARLVAESQPVAEVPSAAAETSPPPEQLQRAMELVAEADRHSRVGDWERAMESIVQAMQFLPDHPRLELQYAFILERLGREEEAARALDGVLQRGDLDPETRAEALRLQNWIEQTLANMDAQGIPRSDPASAGETQILEGMRASPSREPILESMGLQPGATLGIIEAREIKQEEEMVKVLRVAIKSRPDVTVDAADVKVIVRFFEREPDGAIVPTESQASSQWISPPVDWADNEPEILDVMYPLPDPDTTESIFHGYVVAIYHRDELQDTRAVPGGLDQTFAPELFLEPANP